MKTLGMGQLELGQEVKVTFNSGRVLEGKVMDFSRMQTQCWIENEVDIYHVNMHHATVELIEVEQVEEVAPERAPEGLKDLSTIKAEYKEELSLLWNKDVEYHNVMVFNSDEDDVEVWDCEFNTKMEDGERITIYFGTFYNEKDALKHARDMRTKLKRTYDITDKVWVYTC